MSGSGVSDQGMNTSLSEYAGAEASEQEGRRPPVTQEPVQHTMSSNTPLQRSFKLQKKMSGGMMRPFRVQDGNNLLG